ncbi:MAG: hypothetical protein Q9222_005891 [Ikaeria aurantiellina]
MSANNPTPPAYVFASPIGFHVKDVRQYLSQHPTPVSSDPQRLQWTSQESQLSLSRMFQGPSGHTPGTIVLTNLFVYNKTRDIDRICPSCHRIYRVGEGPRDYQSFQDFIDRINVDTGVEEKIRLEQELSEACSGVCFNALGDGEWDDVADQEELDSLTGLARDHGFMLRRAKPEEENATGIKVVWEKLNV